MTDTPITSADIAAAEKLLKLNFSAAQREQMLKTLSDRLAHYDSIRAVPLDNSVPMALNFNVNAADSAPAAVPRSYAMSPQPPVSRPDNLEDIAFLPVTQLAELLRTRQISSLELTEMYLERLKRYDSVLQCVACLTEDLAYAQARRADDEISRGIYRGPLHGVPWGAKDLLATRGASHRLGRHALQGPDHRS